MSHYIGSRVYLKYGKRGSWCQSGRLEGLAKGVLIEIWRAVSQRPVYVRLFWTHSISVNDTGVAVQ